MSSVDPGFRTPGALGMQALALYYQTEVSKEGAAALREKRKADFRSKVK
jgi:2-ketocyclohexanecarboxyl-CoA hydrolase